jgi:hypothetical protein
VKPVVARLVVLGAAVGSLALLAGAAMGQSTAPTPAPESAPVAPTSTPPDPAPPTPATPALETPVRSEEPARPPEPDSTDGSAAVDWLLKGRR